MNNKRISAFLGAIVTWFAVASQFATTYLNVEINPALASIGLLNYFTILTNIAVAIAFSIVALGRQSKLFTNHGSQTAIAVYILVVGIVYSALLRNTWNPQGFQRIVDELLHTLVPLAFLLFWFVFTPKGKVNYAQIPKWLIFPALYLLYSLARGALTGNYPYPFLNANSLGWTSVILISFALTLFLVVLSLLMVRINQSRGREKGQL